MPQTHDTILIPAMEMRDRFTKILQAHGFTSDKAYVCAEVFTESSIDGVYTHGVNRFAKFIQYIKDGHVRPDAEPVLINQFGGVEQWNGNFGPGILNALHATDRAIELSLRSGIGCATLKHTNHWLRGGTYAWRAANKGCAFICFTNTIPNMPAWKAIDRRLGNNPFVMGMPFSESAIVLDMAMSQYSYGALDLARMKGQELEVAGGFDMQGRLTTDPEAIINSGRMLPMGYWKGAGMSLLLDILASVLTDGFATHQIQVQQAEFASQVFIAFDLSRFGETSSIARMINSIIEDYKASEPAPGQEDVLYPGERVMKTRKQNLENGIPVLLPIWEEILQL